jgi:hypothetical protein
MQRHIIPARSAGDENQFAITNDRTANEYLFEYSGDVIKIAGKKTLMGWSHANPDFVPDEVKEAAEEFSNKELIPIHK